MTGHNVGEDDRGSIIGPVYIVDHLHPELLVGRVQVCSDHLGAPPCSWGVQDGLNRCAGRIKSTF